jgi:hypothetical protein
MSKWYRVSLMQIKVVAVELEDEFEEEDAVSFAIDELGWSGADEVTSSLVKEDGVEALIRHADAVSTLEDL